MSYVLGSGSKLYMKILSSPTGDIGTPVYFELPFVSESLNPNADFINSNNLSVGRSTGIGEKGNVAADGSFETEVSIQNLVYLLIGALGNWSDGSITHHDSELPTYEVVVLHGSDNTMPMTFTGAKINNFKMSLVSNAVLTASIDLVGLSYDTESVSLGTPEAMDTTNLLYPSTLDTLTIGGVSVLDDVTSFDFTINSNISTDLSKLDGSGRIALIPGELNVTGTFEAIIDTDDPLGLKSADVGTPLDTIVVTFSATDSTVLTFQNVYVTSITHDVNDRGVLKVSVEFSAFKSGADNPLVVTYTNNNSKIYVPLS